MIITPLGTAVEPEVYWRNARLCRPMPGSDQPSARSSGTASTPSHCTCRRAGTWARHWRVRRGAQAARRQEGVGPGVVDDRLEPGHRPVRPRHRGRDRDGPRVKAAEERRDEVEPRRKDEQDALTFQTPSLHPGRQGAGPRIERRRVVSRAGSACGARVGAIGGVGVDRAARATSVPVHATARPVRRAPQDSGHDPAPPSRCHRRETSASQSP